MASLVDTSEEKRKSNTNHLIVAAIDFGTTFTGFAYSFTYEPTYIRTSKWAGENVRTATDKAPTCVLLSPEKKFVAFGYDAVEKYTSLIEEDKESETTIAKSHYFFEKFKMKLYQTKKLSLDTKLSDVQGKEIPALEVFTVVISHLKKKIYEQLRLNCVGFREDDILWMITVPAIWSDSAKQFMRKASSDAGLETSNVKLILEPEAASLYCNYEKLCKIVKLDGSIGLETFPEGMKYIVADLGGGTADLSVHEVLQDRNLKEIHRADGDALGGILVDLEFFKFLEDIFGSNVMQYLRDNHIDKVMDVQLHFETKKRTFDHTKHGMIRIQIPAIELDDASCKMNEESIGIKVKRASKTPGFETVKLSSNKLSFGNEIMKKFFTRATDVIVAFINAMRGNNELGEINHLLMVGGFSESAYVRHVISQKVIGIRIIAPVEPSLAVLKGAVIAGRNPQSITERITRYTYGFSSEREFMHGKDPEKFKFIRNGVEYCTSVFKKLITKGDILKVGDHFGTPCAHVLDISNVMTIFLRHMPIVTDVYRSEEKDPTYSEEEYGCELVGFVLIPPPITGWPFISHLRQELVVGEAEFTVRAINVDTEEVFEGQLVFLQAVSRK